MDNININRERTLSKKYLIEQAIWFDKIIQKNTKFIDYHFLWGSSLEKKYPKDLDLVIKINKTIKESKNLVIELWDYQKEWATIKNWDWRQYPTDLTIVDRENKAYLVFWIDIYRSKIRENNFKNIDKSRKVWLLSDFYNEKNKVLIQLEKFK